MTGDPIDIARIFFAARLSAVFSRVCPCVMRRGKNAPSVSSPWEPIGIGCRRERHRFATNYPPGLPGKNAALLARIPGGIFLAMQLMRIRWLHRLPFVLGWMAKRPIPHALTDRWFHLVQTQPAIRRDLIKYARRAPASDDASHERLRAFDRPALIVWAREDRVMPPEHGRRLAGLMPNARLEELDDSYTLIPLDRSAEFARLVRTFVHPVPHLSA